MKRPLLVLTALFGLSSAALPQTRPLPPGESRSDGDITVGNALKLGKRESGKTIITPDTLQILGLGSTGDLSDMSVTPSAGGNPRRLKDLLSNDIYAVNYGVVADDGIDDGPPLRAAIAAAQARRVTLRLPAGIIHVCPLAGDAEALLRITGLMSLQGERGTRIEPCATSGRRSVILVKPPANAAIRGMVLRDFSVGPLGGHYDGGDAIRVDTTDAGGYVAKLLVENVGTGTPGPGFFAFHHVNTPAANRTGGLFASTFRGNDFVGGMKFEKTGDSNNILENIITSHNVGIDYEGIAGAAMHRIEGNNITSMGGAIRLKNTIQAKIIRNQMEQAFAYKGAADDNAMVTLDGSSFTTIEDNNANTHGRVDVVSMKNGASHNRLAANNVVYAAANVLLKAAGAPSNRLDPQTADYSFEDGAVRRTPLVSIDAASSPTIGVFMPLPLENGFAAAGGPYFNQGLRAMLAPDRSVRLAGIVSGSALTQGTRIAKLPAAMAPLKAVRIRVLSLASSWQMGVLTIESDGSIRIENLPGGRQVEFDDVSFHPF